MVMSFHHASTLSAGVHAEARDEIHREVVGFLLVRVDAEVPIDADLLEGVHILVGIERVELPARERGDGERRCRLIADERLFRAVEEASLGAGPRELLLAGEARCGASSLSRRPGCFAPRRTIASASRTACPCGA